MKISLEKDIGQKILLAFRGKDHLPGSTLEAIHLYRPGGFTLFRSENITSPAQVRQLTQSLQQIAQMEGLPPFLIACDQEGGQLMAIGEGTTCLPGNMALGAAGSQELAYQAGMVLGCELAALGINVNYAPCCDVNSNPYNPVIGTRSFGEDPHSVAALASAMIAGIQACGVAATAKHFPGHGDTSQDSHYSLPSIPHSLERLRQVELPPFMRAAQSGVRLVMSAHLALPSLIGRDDLPATLSPDILKGLLRRNLDFQGVILSDAMDMKAIRQGGSLGEEAVQAVAAGVDLLLLTTDQADHRRVVQSLLNAFRTGLLDTAEVSTSLARIRALKQWLAEGPPQPDLSLVGCAQHRAIAAEIATRSVTLVRDKVHLLPLKLESDHRLAIVLPKPVDLTPADTSSYIVHSLPQVMRTFHDSVDDFILPHNPHDQDIVPLLQQIQGYHAVIIGTLNAYEQTGQANLVQAVLGTGIPTIVVGMRMPSDLIAFPQASTYLCTYSLLEPSMLALAKVLFGRFAPLGHLPVSIPGLYPQGHGETFGGLAGR
jgi:beta-N-acetylhexosaminidase